jgi:hypothetical protein
LTGKKRAKREQEVEERREDVEIGERGGKKGWKKRLDRVP